MALADKLDTLVGFWAIDEKPTGSKDPYALRRAALGVIRIVLENGLAGFQLVAVSLGLLVRSARLVGRREWMGSITSTISRTKASDRGATSQTRIRALMRGTAQWRISTD